MTKFVCSICGKEYDDLTSYVNCVTTCSKKLQKEREEAENKKRLAEISAAINAIKQAKTYYEEKLNEFKTKYPEEYEFNFGNACKCKCDAAHHAKPIEPKVKTESIELSYESNGKDNPKLSAKVNGKDVSDEYIKKLFDDPDTKYLGKLLGIL